MFFAFFSCPKPDSVKIRFRNGQIAPGIGPNQCQSVPPGSIHLGVIFFFRGRCFPSREGTFSVRHRGGLPENLAAASRRPRVKWVCVCVRVFGAQCVQGRNEEDRRKAAASAAGVLGWLWLAGLSKATGRHTGQGGFFDLVAGFCGRKEEAHHRLRKKDSLTMNIH